MYSSLIRVGLLFCCVLVGFNCQEDDATLKDKVNILTRQLIMQQMYIDERTRSEGHSGLKQIRLKREGTRPYHATTHTGSSVASIHDHANNIRTVGMGEFIGVLNGVEFRTRHNDYRLYMPSTTSKDYEQTEDIPFPGVPDEVIQHIDINDQIAEMREWFKAWKDQDFSVRDYRKYFKPVLCYLEGGWANSSDFQESFESDRHHIDASSWDELRQKIMYTSATGRKNTDENFAFLPTQVIGIDEHGTPQIVQWNYRILCHPLKHDLPLNRLRVVDDLGPRLDREETLEEFAGTREARFTINPYDEDEFTDGQSTYGLLDELMSEIPGKDNYPADVKDTSFNSATFPYQKPSGGQQDEPLNAGFYNRWVRVKQSGAMGLKRHHLGFADENLFVAHNTREEVALNQMEDCKRRVCKVSKSRVSYAIPLEIIYLTPLHSWNPYDLEYQEDSDSVQGTGGKTPGEAFDSIASKIYYMTPDEFFTGGEIATDPADTTSSSVGVLDSSGNVRVVRASGTRVFFPKIEELGSLRQRYPVMPIHGEGNNIWKELEALKDTVLELSKHRYALRDFGNSQGDFEGVIDGEVKVPGVSIITGISQPEPVGIHQHSIDLSSNQVIELINGDRLELETDESNGHTHVLKVRCSLVSEDGTSCLRFRFTQCDGSTQCFDKHGKTFVIADSDEIDPPEDI